jgi:hypothetical protein
MFIDHHSGALVVCHSSGIVTLHHPHAFTIVGFFFICYLFLFGFLLGHGIQHSIVLVVLHHFNNYSSFKCVHCCSCILVFFVIAKAFWFMLIL